MKVEFIDPERTLARLTRGVLWWKQQALVARGVARSYGGPNHWVFQLTGEDCGWDLDRKIDKASATELGRIVQARREEALKRSWQPAGRLPQARLVERSEP